MEYLNELVQAFGPAGGVIAAALIALAIFYRSDMMKFYDRADKTQLGLTAALTDLSHAIRAGEQTNKIQLEAIQRALERLPASRRK